MVSEGRVMERKRRRNGLAWWKQEALVALVVAIYLAFAFGAVQVWSVLSHNADTFTGSVMGIAR
jgi:polyferredoxin